MQRLSRRRFLKSAGVATGAAAALVAAPGMAKAAVEREEAVEVTPSGPLPDEPLVAYVQDAKRGEVTVLLGTRRKTYRDPVLVRRLLKAARSARPATRKR